MVSAALTEQKRLCVLSQGLAILAQSEVEVAYVAERLCRPAEFINRLPQSLSFAVFQDCGEQRGLVLTGAHALGFGVSSHGCVFNLMTPGSINHSYEA